MKLAEVLSGPETWCQMSWNPKAGTYCLLGALAAMIRAEGERNGSYSEEYPRLVRLIGRPDDGGFNIITWNNAPERTWDEVSSLVDAYDRDRMLNP